MSVVRLLVRKSEELIQSLRSLEDQVGVVLPGDGDAAVQLDGLGCDGQPTGTGAPVPAVHEA